MNLKHITVVSIRVVALWWMLSSVLYLASFVGTLAFDQSGTISSMGWTYLVPLIGIAVIQVIAGLIMFLFAVSISNFVCSDIPASDNDPGGKSTIGPGDLYHVAAFGLGIYVIILAIQPVTQAVIGLLATSQTELPISTIVELIQAGLYLTLGVSLTLGAKGLSKFMTSLGHSSDDIPQQQFSLRLILIIVIAIAIVLGIARMLVL